MQEKHYVETPKFTGRNVPVDEIAKATGKSATFLREALKLGIMHFGYAFKKDKQVWEELGYFKEE